jgi:hypothetical protein
MAGVVAVANRPTRTRVDRERALRIRLILHLPGKGR